jgi:hypothetical protein
LGVAKVLGDDWLTRGKKAAAFFKDTYEPERGLGHNILLATFAIESTGQFERGIHTGDFINEGQQLGLIPRWITKSNVWSYLEPYGIRPKQLWLNGRNNNGFEWHQCIKAWNTYISDKERKHASTALIDDRNGALSTAACGSGRGTTTAMSYSTMPM